jgi:hypothetical protein
VPDDAPEGFTAKHHEKNRPGRLREMQPEIAVKGITMQGASFKKERN